MGDDDDVERVKANVLRYVALSAMLSLPSFELTLAELALVETEAGLLLSSCCG